MTPEVGRPVENQQNEIGQILQRYLGSAEFSQHARTQGTVDSYSSDLRRFNIFCYSLGISSTAELKPDNISAWFDELKIGGESPKTLARKNASLTGFLRWGIENNLLEEKLLTESTRPQWKDTHVKRTITGLNQDQVDDLVDAAEKEKSLRDAAYILITVQTGAKLNEIIDLDRRDIIPRKGGIRIRLYNRTTGKERVRRVDKKATQVLSDYLREHDESSDQPLFPGNGRNGRMSHQSFWYLLKKYKTISGAPNLTSSLLHDTYSANRARRRKKSTIQ